jgi:electron transfer flavoprotein alpha subunit
MHCEILIVAEHTEGKPDSRTADLISWGSQIANEKRWKLGVLLLGSNLDQAAEELAAWGIDVALVLDDQFLEGYTPSVYVDAASHVLKEVKPKLILADHSYFGIEVAAALAPRLSAPLISNCQSIRSAGNGFLLTRSMFGGRFLATLAVDEAGPCVVTVSQATSIAKSARTNGCEVVKFAFANKAENKITILGESKPCYGDDITQADVIVSVGRAIRHQDQIDPFRELAQALGGVLAASRPIVDAGWLSPDRQVGLSGVTVKPKVYLALGISGSAQHLAGMNQSKLIIAINSDPSAPIFQAAHCGAVADVFEILPLLLQKAQSAENTARGGETISH